MKIRKEFGQDIAIILVGGKHDLVQKNNDARLIKFPSKFMQKKKESHNRKAMKFAEDLKISFLEVSAYNGY